MKRLLMKLSTAILMISILPSYSSASVALGKKTYIKKFYKKCGFSSVKFAKKHKQGEWEEIYLSGNLPLEAKKICPKLEISLIKSESWENVYQYVTKYAKDGVAANGCND